MKIKIAALFVFLLLISGMATPGYAQLRKDIGSCKGKVVNILSQSQEIVVNDYSSGADRTFRVSPQLLSTLQIGHEVIVIFKKATSNLANAVKVIGKKPVQAMANTKSNVSPAIPAKASSTSGVPVSKSTATTGSIPSAKSSLSTSVPSTKTDKNY